MVRGADLAGLAALLADETRAEMCLALLDGRAWTARELAAHARVAPSTASQHLDRLVAGGLLTERRQGRHRYLQLARPAAGLVEDLVAHVPPTETVGTTLRAATVSAALARGRTCYDHLAGRLGVTLTDAMVERGLLALDSGAALTPAGTGWLVDELGVDPAELSGGRRPLVRACLDWTERRSHLAGVTGALLCRRLRDNDWIRSVGSGRAVRPTPAGERALRRLLGVDVAASL